MGKPVVGEVVVLPFPQTNLQSGKRRPALVVADLAGDDLVLCQITRKARCDGYSVPLVLADFERGRLAVDSFIRSNRHTRFFKHARTLTTHSACQSSAAAGRNHAG